MKLVKNHNLLVVVTRPPKTAVAVNRTERIWIIFKNPMRLPDAGRANNTDALKLVAALRGATRRNTIKCDRVLQIINTSLLDVASLADPLNGRREITAIRRRTRGTDTRNIIENRSKFERLNIGLEAGLPLTTISLVLFRSPFCNLKMGTRKKRN